MCEYMSEIYYTFVSVARFNATGVVTVRVSIGRAMIGGLNKARDKHAACDVK